VLNIKNPYVLIQDKPGVYEKTFRLRALLHFPLDIPLSTFIIKYMQRYFQKRFIIQTILVVTAVLFSPLTSTAYGFNSDHQALVMTATNNASTNRLLIYDTSGNLQQTIPTGGMGGVSGNAGGVEAKGDMVAVVNFGSQSVSIFNRNSSGFNLTEQFSTVSKPVSVAFGNDHLYVLGLTTVESHKISGNNVDINPDGTVDLLAADGSAGQVGALSNQLIISEKSGTVETVNLSGGKVSGSATAVALPAGSDTPFGLITSGDKGYVTIAHSDEISLIKNGEVKAITPSVTQHAPCWLALSGNYLYSANSPSKSISMYVATGNGITQLIPVAASLAGAPTDITSEDKTLAVIDSMDISVFKIEAGGSLSLISSTNTGSANNGIAIVR